MATCTKCQTFNDEDCAVCVTCGQSLQQEKIWGLIPLGLFRKNEREQCMECGSGIGWLFLGSIAVNQGGTTDFECTQCGERWCHKCGKDLRTVSSGILSNPKTYCKLWNQELKRYSHSRGR